MKNKSDQSSAEKSGWILTANGNKVHPLDACEVEIHLEDIAHALAFQCRWNGHTAWYYSVAQHCVLASQNFEVDNLDVPPTEIARQVLLHDATEAYLSDVPKPVKLQMPEFNKHEDRLMEVIMRRFGCRYPLEEPVHHIDRLMLHWEARDLFFPERCTSLFGEAAKEYIRYFDRIEPWGPDQAKWEFLKRAEQLGLS